MKEKLRRVNETLLDLVIGIIIYGVVIGIVGMITTGGNPFYLLGVVAGTAVDIGICVHMLHSLDVALDMDPGSASSYIRKRAVIRFLIMALLALAAIKIHYGCFLGAILALMGIKISALLQRFIHHITKKIIE